MNATQHTAEEARRRREAPPPDHADPAPESAPAPAPQAESHEEPSSMTPPAAPPLAESDTDRQTDAATDDAPPPAPSSSDAPPPAESDKTAAPAPSARPAAAPGSKPTRVGTIAGVKDGKVRVDFGHDEIGACPLEQFDKTPRVGDRFEFVIEKPAIGAAPMHLALFHAEETVTWRKLQRGMRVECSVIGMTTEGLSVRISGSKIRAVIPTRHIDLEPVDDLTPFLNQHIQAKVVTVDRKRKRVVVSRRAIQEDAQRKELIRSLKRGEEREGRVRSVEPFGVFVEIAPGLDGLVRIGDLAWEHVEKAEDVVEVGQTVKVRIMRVDRKQDKIALSIKHTLPNPWELAEQKYPVGSKVVGVVSNIMEFGAFVELEPGIEGLCHISQLSARRVEKVEHVTKVGNNLEAKIVEFDAKRRRIGLSVRALTEPDEAQRNKGKASREDLKKYVKKADEAKAGDSLGALLNKFGGGDSGLKGGLG